MKLASEEFFKVSSSESTASSGIQSSCCMVAYET